MRIMYGLKRRRLRLTDDQKLIRQKFSIKMKIVDNLFKCSNCISCIYSSAVDTQQTREKIFQMEILILATQMDFPCSISLGNRYKTSLIIMIDNEGS